MNTELGDRSTKYTVELPKQSTIQVLATQFAKISGRKPEHITFFNMAGFSIDRQLDLNENINVIDPNARSTPKVLCFDLPEDYNSDKYFIVHMRQRYPTGEIESPFKSLGIPFVLVVVKNITTKEFYHTLWNHLQRVAKKSPEDPDANSQPEDPKLTREQKVEILRENVFPKFDPDNIPFKLSVIEPSETLKINEQGGIPILYSDEDEAVSNSLKEHGKQFIYSVDWLEKSMVKAKETVTVHIGDNNKEVKPHNPNITLDDCLKVFSEVEQLGERDQWYCPQCKTHRCAFKQFGIWSSPETLIIHLKRFGYRRYGREKVTAFVDFPINNLDLSDYMVEKPEEHLLYDLFAVSCHSGGLGGGHYYSYAKNCEDERWYCFNDSSVTPMDESEVKTSNAYLLFYQRKRQRSDNIEVNVEFQ